MLYANCYNMKKKLPDGYPYQVSLALSLCLMNFYGILQNAFIFQLLENFFWLMVVAGRVAL